MDLTGRISAVITSLKRILTFRSAIALALMLWCAGAGCMFVSYARAATNDPSSAAGQMDHAMGSMSMDAHACCKAKHRRASLTAQPGSSTESSQFAESSLLTVPSTPTQSDVMSCCPLTSGSIVLASRSQSNDRATVAQQPDSSSMLLIKSSPSPLAIPLRLPNRAAYLLDCAFLI
jgi:hypothetical protein